MYQLLFGTLALFGGTLAIVAIDKRLRHGEVFDGYEVHWGALIPIAILMNIAALPYYFGKTRASTRWGVVGFGLFLVCVVGSISAQLAGKVIDRHDLEQRHLRSAQAVVLIP